MPPISHASPRTAGWRAFRLAAALLVLTALAAWPALAGPRGPRPRIFDKGYRVHFYDECGTLGANQKQLSRTVPGWVPLAINEIECSPGGVWGDYVYLLLSQPDAAAGIYAALERVTFSGQAENLGIVDSTEWGEMLSITPPGWSGGDILYATTGDRGPGAANGWQIYGIQRSPGWAPLFLPLSGPHPGVGPVAADGSGAFGGDLFYADNGVIIRVDPMGNESVFASPPAIGTEMRFGPGGDWGTDLYTAGSVIAPDGSVTPFPESFGEFDWGRGSGFEGDMFVLVPGSPPTIDRIQPDGTRLPFGTAHASQIAACDGALWLVGSEGCWAVRPGGIKKDRSLVRH